MLVLRKVQHYNLRTCCRLSLHFSPAERRRKVSHLLHLTDLSVHALGLCASGHRCQIHLNLLILHLDYKRLQENISHLNRLQCWASLKIIRSLVGHLELLNASKLTNVAFLAVSSFKHPQVISVFTMAGVKSVQSLTDPWSVWSQSRFNTWHSRRPRHSLLP